ncbi:MAG: hypothetical protein M3276_08365, partial [Actinomycetota bacterium]|nr:hypothetical protein [Actinomycetota bacterium]
MNGATTQPPGRHTAAPGRAPAALLAATLVALIGDFAIALLWRTRLGPGEIAREIVVAAGWAVVGWAAYRLRPERRIGQLMLLFAAFLAINAPAAFDLHDHGWVSSVIATVTEGLAPFHIPLVAHVLLAFPSGRLSERPHRRLIAVAYVYA